MPEVQEDTKNDVRHYKMFVWGFLRYNNWLRLEQFNILKISTFLVGRSYRKRNPEGPEGKLHKQSGW
jgi:hypothetical protein